MANRPKNSWDDFKTVGKAQDFKRPPTLGNRLFVAFGSLVIGLVYGFIASHLALYLFTILPFRHGFFGFFHLPPAFTGFMILFAFGWAIVNWIQGVREEAATRERLERHQARSEQIASKQAKRILRDSQLDPEDEE